MNILKEAEAITHGDREKVYGKPDANLKRIAAIWSVVLGVDVSISQVCLCMVGVKLARMVNQPDHRDSAVDICGYTALMERVGILAATRRSRRNRHKS